MPCVAKSNNQKLDEIIRMFPNELTKSFEGSLHCKLCNVRVLYEKKFNVDNHRATECHKQKLSSSMHQLTLTPIKDFAYEVCDAFLKADIPT